MTEKLLIRGGTPLFGKIEINGSKNSAGAVLAAALLPEKSSIIDNLPLCSDVLDQIEILKSMGAKIKWLDKRKIRIDSKDIRPEKIPFDLFEKMRVSVLLIGPLLARFKKLKVPHPGGDKIGLRPISSHLEALKDFGIKIKEKSGFYYFRTPEKMKGRRIVLKEFSVTATENIMMLAAKAKGKTIIEMAAGEPQVQDLARFLEKMGVEVKGAGNHILEIEGRQKLRGAKFKISPDPLEVGTFLIAFAITQGHGVIKNVVPEHLTSFLEKMKEAGVNFKILKNKILVNKSKKLKAIKIQVLPYPGFPTDLQPMTSVLLSQAGGKSLIHDPLYESRFGYAQELKKMGANIEIVDPHRAFIWGPSRLRGEKITGPDIRAGAALLLAGLITRGQTEISDCSQIDRGYEKIDEKLKGLGAKIKRITLR